MNYAGAKYCHFASSTNLVLNFVQTSFLVQIQDLKHRTDISDEEREHRRKVLMAEVAAGVAGAGILGFAGYQAYQHFNKGDDKEKVAEHPKVV